MKLSAAETILIAHNQNVTLLICLLSSGQIDQGTFEKLRLSDPMRRIYNIFWDKNGNNTQYRINYRILPYQINMLVFSGGVPRPDRPDQIR